MTSYNDRMLYDNPQTLRYAAEEVLAGAMDTPRTCRLCGVEATDNDPSPLHIEGCWLSALAERLEEMAVEIERGGGLRQ